MLWGARNTQSPPVSWIQSCARFGSRRKQFSFLAILTHLLFGLKMKNALASGMGTAFSFRCSSDRGRGRGPTGISGSSSSSSPVRKSKKLHSQLHHSVSPLCLLPDTTYCRTKKPLVPLSWGTLIQADVLLHPMGLSEALLGVYNTRGYRMNNTFVQTAKVLKLKILYAGKPTNTEKKRQLVTLVERC